MSFSLVLVIHVGRVKSTQMDLKSDKRVATYNVEIFRGESPQRISPGGCNDVLQMESLR